MTDEPSAICTQTIALADAQATHTTAMESVTTMLATVEAPLAELLDDAEAAGLALPRFEFGETTFGVGVRTVSWPRRGPRTRRRHRTICAVHDECPSIVVPLLPLPLDGHERTITFRERDHYVSRYLGGGIAGETLYLPVDGLVLAFAAAIPSLRAQVSAAIADRARAATAASAAAEASMATLLA